MTFLDRSGALFSSRSEEWGTPPALFNMLDREFHFTLDPAATKENARCAKYFTKEQNGLQQNWSMDRVFMNCPYGTPDPGYGLFPLQLLKSAYFVIERIALFDDGCGNSLPSPSTSLIGDNKFQGNQCLTMLGDQIGQEYLENISRILSVNPPSPRDSLIELTRLLAKNATDTECFLKLFNSRLMTHLNTKINSMIRRPLIRATRGGINFTIDTDTSLTVNNSSSPSQICLSHAERNEEN